MGPPSLASRRESNTPIHFSRPSAKLIRNGSVRPGENPSEPRRPTRRVSTSNATPISTNSASPLQRAAFTRSPTTAAAPRPKLGQRHSLPTVLTSDAGSPISSLLSPGNTSSSTLDESTSDLGDEVESSFWASTHPLSSNEMIPELPSEPTEEADGDDLVTEVSDLDTDACSVCLSDYGTWADG